MILVLGETYDSLLGLHSLIGKSDGIESLVNDLPGFIGEYNGEPIVGVSSGTSDYLSAISTTKAIERYKPRMIFSLGESSSISSLLKLGDLVIGNRIFIHGVNFASSGVAYGAIPGFNPHYFSDITLARIAEETAMGMGEIRATRGDILSGEKKIVDQEEFTSIFLRHYGSMGHLLCYDCTSGGVALASTIAKVPFLPIKAITYLPLEGEEGVLKERRISLNANINAAKLILEILKQEEVAL